MMLSFQIVKTFKIDLHIGHLLQEHLGLLLAAVAQRGLCQSDHAMTPMRGQKRLENPCHSRTTSRSNAIAIPSGRSVEPAATMCRLGECAQYCRAKASLLQTRSPELAAWHMCYEGLGVSELLAERRCKTWLRMHACQRQMLWRELS